MSTASPPAPTRRNNKKTPLSGCFLLAERVGFARLRTERWSALTATGSHSLPTLRIPLLQTSYQKQKTPFSGCFCFGGESGIRPPAGGAVVGSDCHRQSFTTDPVAVPEAAVGLTLILGCLRPRPLAQVASSATGSARLHCSRLRRSGNPRFPPSKKDGLLLVFFVGGEGGICPPAGGAVVGSDCHRQSFTTDPSNPVY